MTINTNIIRIGNSKGVILPSKILKTLALDEKDSVCIIETEGSIVIRKTEDGIPLTPFSALDRWCDENCHEESCSVEDALQYVDAVRKERNDKTIMTW
ncbi:MAG: AbrB/MazE/SpoVT family DNA-binding domain-containing protein [Bacteroidales bacterium]|nr:AbrB/MazE/SpoVT family DNA-binding domain-containing protein [Bacteroidales bacterium]